MKILLLTLKDNVPLKENEEGETEQRLNRQHDIYILGGKSTNYCSR